jgi:hypothetical protein
MAVQAAPTWLAWFACQSVLVWASNSQTKEGRRHQRRDCESTQHACADPSGGVMGPAPDFAPGRHCLGVRVVHVIQLGCHLVVASEYRYSVRRGPDTQFARAAVRPRSWSRGLLFITFAALNASGFDHSHP